MPLCVCLSVRASENSHVLLLWELHGLGTCRRRRGGLWKASGKACEDISAFSAHAVRPVGGENMCMILRERMCAPA